MAYAGDLKSLALRGVRVRLPPRAPTKIMAPVVPVKLTAKTVTNYCNQFEFQARFRTPGKMAFTGSPL